MNLLEFFFLALVVLAALMFAGVAVATLFGLAEDPRGPGPHRDDE